MIRRFFNWLENWAMDDPNMFIGTGKMMFIVCVALAIILTPILYLASKHDEQLVRQCIEAGGAWQAIGSHQTTTYITVGKVLVPQTQTVTDYGCVGGTKLER